MSQEDFARSLRLVLIHEGGNDDDPRDHGGRTSRGITQKEYDAWRRQRGLATGDVWQATDAEIQSIYHDQYWEPYCDNLPPGLDYEFFDFCVNAGRTQAVKTLQRSLLTVPADGMFGVRTEQAVRGVNDITSLLNRYSDLRRSFYRANAQFGVYGRGWIRRTDEVEASALAMANGAPHPLPTVALDGATAKANPENVAQPMVSMQTGATASAVSSVVSGISDQLQQVSAAIQPVSETFMWAKYIGIAIAVICAGLAIYAVIHHNRMKEVV